MTNKEIISHLLFKNLQERFLNLKKHSLKSGACLMNKTFIFLKISHNEETLNRFIFEYHPDNKAEVEKSVFGKIEK